MPELLEQNKSPGEVAFLDYSGRYIYYLVTKVASTGKPTWDDFERSVIEWRDLCVQHKVTKIAIPRLGCGRDLLDWGQVKNLLNRVFSKHGIEITVCNIDVSRHITLSLICAFCTCTQTVSFSFFSKSLLQKKSGT